MTVQQCRYVLADVFTDRPLAGNQLAVFLHAAGLPEHLLLPVAREMNLSETVFVYPPAQGGTAWVRYFTTSGELDFAGHPTLGTAAVLAQEYALLPENDSVTMETEILLETNRGVIPVQLNCAGAVYAGWMTQPVPAVQPWQRTAELLSVLQVQASRLPVEVYDNGISHLYVMLDDPAAVLGLVPNFPALGRVCGPTRINVFAGTGGEYTSRMFSPFDVGMPEDPACGSAAGPLAAHLLRHGLITSGTQVTISQGEKVGRPSLLYATATGGPEGISEVRVGGSAVIIGGGALNLEA